MSQSVHQGMADIFWEKTYADPNAKSFGGPSPEILELIPALPANARILDLGCGDGRNCIPLARAGHKVTGVDISRAGINKLNLLAKRGGLSIHTVLADMTSYEIPHEFDLIISQGCLHFLKPDQWGRLISAIKDKTAQNGFNAITVFTDQIPAPPDLAGLCVGLFKQGELYDRYQDWEITLKKSYTFQDAHPGGIRHTHAANKLVAQKTSI